MSSGFYLLQTISIDIACLLRLFGFTCVSANKIYEYDKKNAYTKFFFKGESDLNANLDGQAVIIYAQSILDKKKNDQFKKAEKKLDDETKIQIKSCLNFIRVYECLDDRLRNSTYLEVHIKRQGKMWKIPNIGEDWEKFKKKFNISGIKSHKDHEKEII
jgi:hypothetical protein